MLQGNDFWTEECRSYISKTSEQNVQQTDGRNMKVYVDDMLVKSKEELEHLDDLRETFATLK